MSRDLSIPAMIMALGAFLIWGTQLHHDVSWYLISTGWWLDGLPIYAEIFELNPPLAFYLTAPPVFLANLTGLPATAVMQAYVFALIAASLIWSLRLLARAPAIGPPERQALLATAALGLVLLPLPNFAQREHLFIIFALPYLILNVALVSGAKISKRERAAIAVFSVLGIALKHYFVLLPLFVLIARCITIRSLRGIWAIEHLILAALLIAYVPASMLLHPAYFSDVIPRTFQVYGAYDAPMAEVIRNALPTLSMLAIAASLSMVSKRHPATPVFWAAAVATLAVYLIQSKGWSYQRVPLDLFAVLLVGWLAAQLVQSRVHWWPALPAAIAIAPTLLPALRHGPYFNNFYKHAATHFTCPPGQRSYQTFASNVAPSFPLGNYADAEPANRAPALWLFPGATYQLTKTSDPDQIKALNATREEARDMVLNDFFRARPQLVYVDTKPQKAYFNGADFDYLDFFLQDTDFAKAWQNYSLAGQSGQFEVYFRPGCD